MEFREEQLQNIIDNDDDFDRTHHHLAETLLSTRAELAALQDKVRWVPVEERLPEVDDTEPKDVVYQIDGDYYPGQAQYIRKISDWSNNLARNEYGTLVNVGLSSTGRVVKFWKSKLPLPIPAEGE